jgi:multiple sugar transport system permease protein
VKAGGRGNLRITFLPLMMVLPSLVLVGWIIGYPLYDTARTSVHAVSRFGQVREFVGAANFASLFHDAIFWASFGRTLLWTVGVAGGALLISAPVALILDGEFGGRGLARVIIMLPWAIAVTMTGIVWRWTLNGHYGLLNATLERAGLLGAPVEWLATARTAFPIEIAIGVLVAMPLTVTIYLGGLSSLPEEIFEAARIDGARAGQRLRYLAVPLLRPFLSIALVLNVIYAFNSFSIIWVLTQGDPANSTDILVTYLFKMGFRYGRLDEAAAMSLLMFAFLLAFSILYAGLIWRQGES